MSGLRQLDDGDIGPDEMRQSDCAPFHRCGCCGAVYSREQWARLHHCGTQRYEYADGDAELLEHRDCPCGSTMAVDLYATGDVLPPERNARHPELQRALTDAERAGDRLLVERLLRELARRNTT